MFNYWVFINKMIEIQFIDRNKNSSLRWMKEKFFLLVMTYESDMLWVFSISNYIIEIILKISISKKKSNEKIKSLIFFLKENQCYRYNL